MIELVMEVTSLRSSHTRSYDLKISHSQIRPLPSRLVPASNESAHLPDYGSKLWPTTSFPGRLCHWLPSCYVGHKFHVQQSSAEEYKTMVTALTTPCFFFSSPTAVRHAQ